MSLERPKSNSQGRNPETRSEPLTPQEQELRSTLAGLEQMKGAGTTEDPEISESEKPELFDFSVPKPLDGMQSQSLRAEIERIEEELRRAKE